MLQVKARLRDLIMLSLLALAQRQRLTSLNMRAAAEYVRHCGGGGGGDSGGGGGGEVEEGGRWACVVAVRRRGPR